MKFEMTDLETERVLSEERIMDALATLLDELVGGESVYVFSKVACEKCGETFSRVYHDVVYMEEVRRFCPECMANHYKANRYILPQSPAKGKSGYDWYTYFI